MSRIVAREDCFKLMFEYEFLKNKNEVTLNDFLDSAELEAEEKTYVTEFYDGLIEHNAELEEVIAKNIKGYTLNRIFKVDLAILKIAIYEMKFLKDAPISVIINEAVELSKKYSTEKSYSFINGVLATISKEEN